jgi:acetylornithine/N-succinyldiaminopimelate aminotransferase
MEHPLSQRVGWKRKETGEYFRNRLEEFSAAKGLGEVRGRGLLLALSLGREAAEGVVERALGEGLLLNAPRPDTLRFMPALTVSREEIDGMVAVLGRCV